MLIRSHGIFRMQKCAEKLRTEYNETHFIFHFHITKRISFKTDSVQRSSNTCKNYLLKIYSQHANFLNAII